MQREFDRRFNNIEKQISYDQRGDFAKVKDFANIKDQVQ